MAPKPSSVQPDVSYKCFVLPIHPGGGFSSFSPVPSPTLTSGLWRAGEVRDLGSSGSSLSVCPSLLHLAVLLFNIAPKVF